MLFDVSANEIVVISVFGFSLRTDVHEMDVQLPLIFTAALPPRFVTAPADSAASRVCCILPLLRSTLRLDAVRLFARAEASVHCPNIIRAIAVVQIVAAEEIISPSNETIAAFAVVAAPRVTFSSRKPC